MMKNISLSSKIIVNEDVVSRNLQGEIVLLNLKTNLYCGLDETGTKIWQMLSDKKQLSDILDDLTREYNVLESKCTEDLFNFINLLREKDFIQII
jgi:hypothetical protein